MFCFGFKNIFLFSAHCIFFLSFALSEKLDADIRSNINKKKSTGTSNIFENTIGSTNSGSKGNIQTIFSKGKGQPSTSNSSSTKSKSIISGGILMPRESSNMNNALFTNLGSTNSDVPSSQSGPSDSRHPSHKIKTGGNSTLGNRSKQKSIIDAFDDTRNAKRTLTQRAKDCNWKMCNSKTNRLPLSSDTNGVKFQLPGGFQSVCVHPNIIKGRGRYNTRVGGGQGKKRMKKYVFDELDEDNGLWDESDSKHLSDRNHFEIENNSTSSSPLLNKKFEDDCNISSQEFVSPNLKKVKRNTISDFDSEDSNSDCITLSSFVIKEIPTKESPSTSFSSQFQFPGKGYRLGGTGGTKSRSRIIGNNLKNRHKNSSSSMYSNGDSNSNRKLKSTTLDLFLSQGKVSAGIKKKNKRSLEEAFSSCDVIDISDSDEDQIMSISMNFNSCKRIKTKQETSWNDQNKASSSPKNSRGRSNNNKRDGSDEDDSNSNLSDTILSYHGTISSSIDSDDGEDCDSIVDDKDSDFDGGSARRASTGTSDSQENKQINAIPTSATSSETSKDMVPCPVCSIDVELELINAHLDTCLVPI